VLILLGNALSALALILGMVIQFAIIIVVIDALISWVNPDPFNPIVRFLRSATDPMLRPIRKRVPLIGGNIDLSPIILIFVLYFLSYFLVESLDQFGMKLVVQGGGFPRARM
jgi:YggT family protein